VEVGQKVEIRQKLKREAQV